MNLIEQLGGYEKAKRELQLKIDNSVLQCCMSVTADMIQDALLEYRQENNIFEVGDKVVFKKEYGISNSSVIDIYKVSENMFQFQTIFGSTPVDTALIRHATDKEIAQGYRDE